MELNNFDVKGNTKNCSDKCKISSPTLLYGLPRTFRNDVNTGPKFCKCIPEVELSTNNFSNNVNASNGIYLNEDSFLIEQNNELFKRIKDSSVESEFCDVPLDSVSNNNSIFEVSDISYQLKMLSPSLDRSNTPIQRKCIDLVSKNDTCFEENKSNTFIDLPALDDGLSSDSDVGRQSKVKNDSFRVISSSCSLESEIDAICGDNYKKNSFSFGITCDTMLDSSLMQDISNDINDIKRTLSVNRQSLSENNDGFNEDIKENGGLIDSLNLYSDSSQVPTSEKSDFLNLSHSDIEYVCFIFYLFLIFN